MPNIMANINKPKLNELSKEEKARYYSPIPPEYLVDALNDPIHKEVGKSRPARVAPKRRKTMTDYQLSKIYAEAMEGIVDYPISLRLFMAKTSSLLENLMESLKE
jgi:hypothetical protein